MIPVLARFSPATRTLLKERALLRRVDTKFALGSAQLDTVLERLADDYAIMLAEGEPVARYRTLYFDSADLRCLTDHQRGRRPRHKVRVRHYEERRLTFLEVKMKTSGEQTVKWRRPLGYLESQLSAEDLRFVDSHCPIGAEHLAPRLWTNFRRVSLVGLRTPERVTIDVDLDFEGDDMSASMPGIVIAEVKQRRFIPRSPVMLALRAHGIRPLSLSKYCTGASFLCPGARNHRYRPRLHAVRRLRSA